MRQALKVYLKPIQYGVIGGILSATFAKLGGRWVTSLTFKEAGVVGAVFGTTLGATVTLWMEVLGKEKKQRPKPKFFLGAVLLAATISRFSNRSIRLLDVTKFNLISLLAISRFP